MRNIVVLGMHRSGTSMVARALASAGVYVGQQTELLSDQEDNPNGFWERKDVVALNDEILHSTSYSWFNPPPSQFDLTDEYLQVESKDSVQAIISRLNGGATASQSWLLKDPRLVITWPCWKNILGDALLIYVYRDPWAVAYSLNKRHGFPLLLGVALWEIYNHAALRVIEGRNAVCVSFDDLSMQPESELKKIFKRLDAEGVGCEGLVTDELFDPSLVHHNTDANRDFVLSLLSESQAALVSYCGALCASQPVAAKPELDEKTWSVIADIASALAPLATVIETQNEAEALSRLCLERTRERDDSLTQLSGVESAHTALAEAHREEISQHKLLEGQHRGLMEQHQALSDEHGAQLKQYTQLEQAHQVLANKAEYLFTELSGAYAKLLGFEQSYLATIWRFTARVYRLVTRRRGVNSSYDDVLADAYVHVERYQLSAPDGEDPVQAPLPQGKLSLLADVMKYVAKNPAGSVRSFSLPRLKRATQVFLKSNPDDLDVWVNSRFPSESSSGDSAGVIDPKNLDASLDQLELAFPPIGASRGASTISVSIVIPVYNDYRMTVYCLQQLLEHTSNVNYEVIIGDDCSTDLTADITDRVSNITVVRGDKNRGFLENCNAAAAVAQGEHVLFLNNDTGVCENWLAPLVQILEENPSVGIVGPKLLFADGKLQEAGGIVWDDASAWNFGRMDDPAKPEYNYVREVDYISGACLLVRGEFWRRLGGFDKRYVPAYYEDTDIAFEARAAGYTVVYQPLSQVFHFEGVSNGTDLASGIKQYQVQNQQKFREKWKKGLAAFHFPNAQQIFRARDRSRNKRSVLFIDHYVPHYDKDAGSRSTFMYVQLMLEMGYKVLFLGANYFPHKPYTQKLQQLGVEVLVGESMARNQDRWLIENAPYIDRIYLHRPHIAEQILGSLEKMKPRPPIIFFGHDLHYLRIGREEKVVGDASLIKSEQKWKKREYAVFDRVDKIYYPSQVEVDEILTERPDLSVRAIPLYVLEGEVEEPYDFDSSSDILFVGGFNHPPNVDGICWFVEKVFPLVKEKFPDIKLHVVGSNPNDAVQDLQSEDVVVYGYLSDEELGQLYRRVRQVIAPLRFGAGVKGKVLEAIQKNLPLVTTSIGAEGIPDAEDVMNIANSAEEFAKTIIRLDGGDTQLLAKMKQYDAWLKTNFSKEKAMSIILEDFGPPEVSV
ncbi:MAG: GT2 family glycosyltransferase [Halioglobus sp.]|jgi:GT2 family glycosyltransferase